MRFVTYFATSVGYLIEVHDDDPDLPDSLIEDRRVSVRAGSVPGAVLRSVALQEAAEIAVSLGLDPSSPIYDDEGEITERSVLEPISVQKGLAVDVKAAQSPGRRDCRFEETTPLNHLHALEQKHATIDRDIEAEQARPAPDEIKLQKMKREKLALKDEISKERRKLDSGPERMRA